MKWIVSLLMMVILVCGVSAPVKADVCADYAAYLAQVEADLAQTYASLLKVEADIADKQDAINDATLALQTRQAYYNYLNSLFYVDPDVLKSALEAIKAAQAKLTALKEQLKTLQEERDRLSTLMLNLAEVRQFLQDYLNTHCVQNPGNGPVVDPNFP